MKGPLSVKYNKNKKQYVYRLKTRTSWKTAKYWATVGLGAGSRGRGITFWVTK